MALYATKLLPERKEKIFHSTTATKFSAQFSRSEPLEGLFRGLGLVNFHINMLFKAMPSEFAILEVYTKPFLTGVRSRGQSKELFLH